jgi:hypothetical protein
MVARTEPSVIKREKNVTVEPGDGSSGLTLVKRAGQPTARVLFVLEADPDGVVNLGTTGDRDYWFFHGDIYSTPVTLTADELELLIEERAKPPKPKARSRRKKISREVRDVVWARDGGKCVVCGSRLGLQFDHKTPFSAGGSDDADNLQILCGRHNREKGAQL